MSKKGPDLEQVGAVFIKMGAKRMSEGVAGETFFPAKPALMGVDVPGKIERVDRPVSAGLFREEPAKRLAIGKPVLSEQIKSCFGKDGIAVLPALGMTDMYPHIFTVDIFVSELTDLTDTQTGRVPEFRHVLQLQVRHSGDKVPDLFL